MNKAEDTRSLMESSQKERKNKNDLYKEAVKILTEHTDITNEIIEYLSEYCINGIDRSIADAAKAGAEGLVILEISDWFRNNTEGIAGNPLPHMIYGISKALGLDADELIRSIIDRICCYYTDAGYTIEFKGPDGCLYKEEEEGYDPRERDILFESNKVKDGRRFYMKSLGTMSIMWNNTQPCNNGPLAKATGAISTS